MKHFFTFVLAALCFAACTQNDVEELTANRADVPETLTVGFEGGDTRIELNEALKTVWTKGDLASVFYKSDANQKWQYKGETGERLGTLKCVDAGTATTRTDLVVVAYPYNTNYILNRTNGNIEASLPALHSYKEGSYGSEGNIMVAQSEFTQFSLRSVCGWLRVELTGEGQKVESITLRGNAGEQVAGLIYVDTATAEATLASEMGEASDEEQVGGVGGGLDFDAAVFTEVTLNCGSGVELGAEAKAFYIGLLPQTFESGVTIEVDCAGYKPMTLSTDSGITIERNHIVPMEAVEHDAEYKVPANQIWYTATAKVESFDTSDFNVAIVSNEWDEATGEGVITFDGELTTIGVSAFNGCRSLTSVTIPDSVTTIGKFAFASCSSLAEFKGKFAADGGRCLIKDNTLIAYAEASGTTYTIPDSVTTIGDWAFADCLSLTSVTIGNSVTTIGGDAFYNCNSLTSVTIPDRVTTIGHAAFENCDSLTSVYITDVATWCNISFGGGYFSNPLTNGADLYLNNELVKDLTIPDSVTWINDYAFYGCDSLTSVVIPNSVTTIGIGGYAFYGCDSLTSVTIPDSVTWIGYAAFAHCSNLISVYCKAIIPPPIQNDVFDENYTDRKIYAYEECVDIYKAAWSEYADSIVTGGNIPESVTTTILYTTSDGAIIDASKFPVKSHTYNNGIGELILYGELTTIPHEMFRNYDTLITIIIPDSVTTIGDGVFGYCSSLAKFKGKFAADGGRCLVKDNAIIAYAEASGTTYTIPDSVTTIGDRAFDWCESLTSVTIPDSVTAIGDFAFSECQSLTRVTIPDSVTAIGDWAFSWCDCLTSVTITDSVTAIGEGVFFGCYSLTSVVIPSSVTMIGGWAFQDCDSLTSVTIPNSVTTIGYEAFYECSSLKSVYCEATTPPAGGSGMFGDTSATIYIPEGSLREYKMATNWSDYADRFVEYDFEAGEVVE